MILPKIVSGLGALILLGSLTACSVGADPINDSDANQDAGSSTGLGADANAMLTDYGIAPPASVEELIGQLQSQPLVERPDGLLASVRVGELLLTSKEREVSLPLPENRFHLSVAPYLNETHECFNHSLTTCAGELASAQMQVTITDATSGEVLIDRDVTTFENGFFDVWLPTDREITLRINDGERGAEVPLATGADDPTCVTTVRLS